MITPVQLNTAACLIGATLSCANAQTTPTQPVPSAIFSPAQPFAPEMMPRNSTLFCLRLYAFDANCDIAGSSDDGTLPYGAYGAWLVSALDVQPVSPTSPPAKPAKEPTQPSSPAAQPEVKPTPSPSLDDLLGIKPKNPPERKPATTPTDPKPDGSASPAPDQSREQLDRLLSAQEMGDAFKQAISLMGDASKRLNDHNDTGVDTQRVQEDVIKRLDQLLASLAKQKSQGSPSPSKPQPNQDSQSSPADKKPGKGDQARPQPGGDGTQATSGPTLQEGQLKPELESARAAWGSLPARVRAMLMQGTEDRFSARYKAMTQEYYKRLAEENSK